MGAAMAAAAIVLVTGPGAIAWLRRAGLGQQVRPEGPARHAAKAGTPTMGGLFLVAGCLAAWALLVPPAARVGPDMAVLAGFGALGALDDLRAILRRRSLGLRAREKLAGQLLLGLAASAWAWNHLPRARAWLVPLWGTTWEPAPWLGVAAGALVLVASANAVNLTDGLDGLAAGSVAAASLAYAAIGWARQDWELAVLAAAVAGACLGFLWFNAHPAQVFMGDTGSLALGAALGWMALRSGTVLALPVVGGLFVAETLSVMAQVAYFRWTGGRRLLRMSPLHHHLELSGWAEPQVVVRLWVVSALCAAGGFWAVTGGRAG